jgi:hypothetical protein
MQGALLKEIGTIFHRVEVALKACESAQKRMSEPDRMSSQFNCSKKGMFLAHVPEDI